MFKKIFILIILISILSILCINFYENYGMHPPYSTEGLNQSQIPYVFKTSGEVVRVQNYGFDIVDVYKNHIPILSSTKPELGKQVEILGTLEPSGYFKSIKWVVITKWGYESLILRSIIGLLVIMVIFLKYWKLDLKKFLFLRR